MLGQVQSLDRVSFKFWPPFLTRRRVRHEGSSRLARKDGTAGHGGGGGGAVITDISFQRVSPGYKSSLGRPLLGHCPRESLSFFPSLCFSSLAFFPSVRHPPPSSFPLPLSSSLVGIARPRCDRERGREREREGRREKKSPYQNSWSVPASPCRKSISQSANFHSYTSLEIGTRAGFQSREFPSTPSRLFFSPSPLSPQSLLRFNRRLRDPPLRKWTRREESLNGS